MKRADVMSPVIVITLGRVVNVVFKKGFDLLKQKHNSTYTIPDVNQAQQENRLSYYLCYWSV
ncbi:hypothetical protein [Candidatus Orientia mediorientalis]|uniref:hypothetical protein n=1 Tax=Candidatus Orientia mediorientalis TaxID=911112 RepID=UPI001E4CE2B6|nr:hypothetical protein [Candidatus Orientia mediorientalis]